MPWKRYNWYLLLLPLLVFSLSFITLLSVAPKQAHSQALFFLLGFGVYLVGTLINYQYLLRFWKGIYLVTLSLLALTFMLGHVVGGSARWLRLGGFVFQPSELAKIALLFLLAHFVESYKNFPKNLKSLAGFSLMSLPYIALVFVQPDLGTTIVLALLIVGTLLFLGIDRYLVLLILGVVGLLSDPVWSHLHAYQKRRILVFLNPKIDVLGAGYNVMQSLIAIGSGGLLGKGFGRGTQSHLAFLPAYWTDFIFASYSEEWGFVGVAILLSLYFGLLWVLLQVTYSAPTRAGRTLGFGIFLIFLIQIVINVGMNLGIMPVTGIPLPLMTYGGSSMIVNMFLLGIAQNIWFHKS